MLSPCVDPPAQEGFLVILQKREGSMGSWCRALNPLGSQAGQAIPVVPRPGPQAHGTNITLRTVPDPKSHHLTTWKAVFRW